MSAGFLQATNALSPELLGTALAITGIVIIVSALLSGLIERSGLPQVAVFLALGAMLGPAGLGLLNLTLDAPAVHVVATLSLTLVLFTDAVSLNIAEVRRHSALALRVLGPGTLLSAAVVAFAGWLLLGLPVAAATILGAALASTDPVLLRGVLRRRDIPGNARQALQLESGLNDAVLLPIVIVAMVFLIPNTTLDATGWARIALNLFLLGPGAGIAVGVLAVAALDLIRKRIGVRRDYESLYSLGVAFTAFAAAEAVHGSGFLAAFTAGLTIAALDVELCDCFIEYGGVTAEMLLLFTFVLFGSSLIWSGLTVIDGRTLLFVAIVILIRPPIYLLSLVRSGVDRRSRLLIAWFGPRGLSSLLLILLPVFAGIPGSERLFPICCLVVLVSVMLHGGSPMLLTRLARRRAIKEAAASSDGEVAREFGSPPGMAEPVIQTESEDDESDQALAQGEPSCALKRPTVATKMVAPDYDGDDGPLSLSPQSISIEDLGRLWQRDEQVVILDVRTERSLETSDLQARGAVRMPPDHVATRAKELGLSHEAWLIAYCA